MHYFSYSQKNQENKEVIICFLALFSTSLLTLVISCVLITAILTGRYKIYSHCGFHLHSLMIHYVKYFFMYLYVLLGKISIQIFYFFN